jgi:hypothetical protein
MSKQAVIRQTSGSCQLVIICKICHYFTASLVNYLAQVENKKKIIQPYLMVVWARYGCTEFAEHFSGGF